MSETAKVTASPTASVTSAANRVATGSRYASSERIDGASAAAPPGLFSQWRSGEDTTPQDDFNQRGRGGAALELTPFVVRAAAGFTSDEATTDGRSTAPLFLTDLMRGVGIYEFNMKVFAGTLKPQGSVINRYS